MSCCERHSAAFSRRGLLGAAVGVGALAVAATARASEAAHPAHKVEAVLLTCMDYRLTDDVDEWMEERGLRDKYDHLILAGASLGATAASYPAWAETFWNHLDLAVKLHSVSRVIVLDHRDCGAYKLVLGEDLKSDPQRELKVHADYLYKLREQIVKRQPNLQVELALMSLDGTVAPIV